MRILYSDGEGLEHGDLNLQREILLRHLFDSILANFAAPDQVSWATKQVRQTETLRPFRNAGFAVPINGGTTVEVYGGLWLQMDYSTALSSDGPTALVAHRDTKETIVGFVATAATTFRRDIIQARLVSADDASTNRDFKDAITGALSTTPLVKRSRIAVEYARKAGVEVASQALADDPTTEVAPDAGWVTIHSILCDENGIQLAIAQNEHWDWRKPWGYSAAVSKANDWFFTSGQAYGLSGTQAKEWDGDGAGSLFCHCPFDLLQLGTAMYRDSASIRIEEAWLTTDFVTAPLDADIRFIANTLNPSGGGNVWDDVGLKADAGVLANQIAGLVDQPPLWSNGRSNPGRSTISNELFLTLEVVTRDVSDTVNSVRWAGWGGA